MQPVAGEAGVGQQQLAQLPLEAEQGGPGVGQLQQHRPERRRGDVGGVRDWASLPPPAVRGRRSARAYCRHRHDVGQGLTEARIRCVFSFRSASLEQAGYAWGASRTSEASI